MTIALSLPAQYTSTASFIARGASAPLIPSALQSLAASAGIGTARDYSPLFYADLLTSRPVIAMALQRTYTLRASDSTRRVTYYDIEDIVRDDTLAAMEAAYRRLRKSVLARADARTNIIGVSVTARYPEFSRDILRALLGALDSLNITFRQQQSRELREFFEGRVFAAQRELDEAEAALRHFLERNRAIQNSPELAFEQLRLTRAADLKRTLYVTVVQQYEEAKLQESRNVPLLTVLSEPTLPVRKSGPPRRFIVLLGALLGFGAMPAFRAARRFASAVLERARASGPAG